MCMWIVVWGVQGRTGVLWLVGTHFAVPTTTETEVVLFLHAIRDCRSYFFIYIKMFLLLFLPNEPGASLMVYFVQFVLPVVCTA